MKKHVIALGRQFGSGGREIGRKLSESLGFAYYDRELLKLAAERAEVGEELFADKDEKAGNPWLFKAFYQGGPKVKQGQSAEASVSLGGRRVRSPVMAIFSNPASVRNAVSSSALHARSRCSS